MTFMLSPFVVTFIICGQNHEKIIFIFKCFLSSAKLTQSNKSTNCLTVSRLDVSVLIISHKGPYFQQGTPVPEEPWLFRTGILKL